MAKSQQRKDNEYPWEGMRLYSRMIARAILKDKAAVDKVSKKGCRSERIYRCDKGRE